MMSGFIAINWAFQYGHECVPAVGKLNTPLRPPAAALPYTPQIRNVHRYSPSDHQPMSKGIAAALKHYARLRRPRVTRVQRAARQAGRIYHLAGPAAYARDLAIQTMGAKRMLARQAWIYDWRA